MFFAGIFGSAEIQKAPASARSSKSIYDITLNDIYGNPLALSQFKGKKILFVNVASYCGYTPQYTELQQLHEKYGSKVVVIGVPSNDFGAQEPGTNKEIAEFCSSKFHTTFLMVEKIKVKGAQKHELYKWLSSKAENGWNEKEPTWNFCKYLVNEKGELVRFFKSSVSPINQEITSLL